METSNVEGRPVALLPGLRPSLGAHPFGRFAPADPRRRVPPASGLLAASPKALEQTPACATQSRLWCAHGEPLPFPTKEHPGFEGGESVDQARRRSTQLAMLGFACAWLRSLRARCARGVTDGSMAWSACLPMKPRDGLAVK